MGAAAVWIEAVGMVAGHITGLPDVYEIGEVGEATHFCNKEEILIRWNLLAWPTSFRVFNMSINPVKSQYTHATVGYVPANLGRMFFSEGSRLFEAAWLG